VDKITQPSEELVRLCNYIDVYNHDYITSHLEFMRASATRPEIAKFRLHVGDVIITKDSETPDDIGIPAVVDYAAPDLVCGYHLGLIRPNHDEVDSTFLAKQLSHHRIARYFGRQANGLTRYGLPIGAVNNTPLWLPEPNEQKAIGLVLRLVDEAIAKTEAVIAKLRQLRSGLLHDLLTRGLDEHGQLRNPITHPEQFHDTLLGYLPCRWHLCRLGDVLQCPPRNGYSPREGQAFRGSYLLGLSCLTSEGFAPLQLKNAPTNDPQLSPFLLRDGDLLISRSNTRDLVGLPGVFRNVGYPCYYPDLMMRLIPKAELITEFLELLLRHSRSRSMLVATASGTSGSMVKITGTGVIGAPIAYPDIDEQQRILTTLAPFDEELKTLHAERLKLTMLKSGLMADLLTGRVRMPEGIAVEL
jgi:type I restriction enzyme S subunit